MKNWTPGVRPKSVKDNPKNITLRLVIAIAATLNIDPNKLAEYMQTTYSKEYAKRFIKALDGQIKTRYEEAVKTLSKKS